MDYFAKLLPIGDIEKLLICTHNVLIGDKYLYIDETDDNSIHKGFAGIIETKVDPLNGEVVIFDNKTFLFRREVFKPIGIVSEGAVWVKEGDYFSKEQLLANGVGPNWSEHCEDFKVNEAFLFRFKILCSNCKTFH